MRSTLVVVALSCMWLSSAHAHINLLEPTARYSDVEAGENKACPCGVGLSNRVCDVEGDRSDPDRAVDRVTTLVAGSTVTVRFEEYVAHSGRFRVAIDYDGADLTDFNDNILLDLPDPAGRVGNSGQGSIWELEVPLPDTPCDNCTLQLLQMMDGNMDDPVLDPVGRSSYYACADIVLLGKGAPTPSDGGASGGGNTPGGGSGNTPGGGSGPADAGGAATGGRHAVEGNGCQIDGAPPSGLLSLSILLLALRLRRGRVGYTH